MNARPTLTWLVIVHEKVRTNKCSNVVCAGAARGVRATSQPINGRVVWSRGGRTTVGTTDELRDASFDHGDGAQPTTGVQDGHRRARRRHRAPRGGVLQSAVRTAAAGGRRRPPKPVGARRTRGSKGEPLPAKMRLLVVQHVHTPLHISPLRRFLDRFSAVTREGGSPGTIPCGHYGRWLPLATPFR